MAHKLCSASWLMLSTAPLLSFSISTMDADFHFRMPFGLVLRIIHLLGTIRHYIGYAITKMIAAQDDIGYAITKMIAAQDVIKDIIQSLDNEIVAQGGQPPSFYEPVF